MKIQVLLFSLITILASPAFTQDLSFKIYTDLNGDGTKEHVVLDHKAGTTDFTLKIGTQSISGSFPDEGEEIEGFEIVDIFTEDTNKEIALRYGSTYGVTEWRFFAYDGQNIRLLAKGISNYEAKGNGILYDNTWMGFWSKIDKYQLDNAGKLAQMHQAGHYVGVKAKVKQSFAIFQDQALSKHIAFLGKNSDIEILLWAPENTARSYEDEVYLIKSSAGLVGWAKWSEISSKLEGIPYAG